jgi:uncharacterized phage-like protein YoqJ
VLGFHYTVFLKKHGTIFSMKTLALTGHRPSQLGGYDENNSTAENVKIYLRRLLEYACESEYDTFIIGMAQGVDQWAGEILIQLKREYQHIKIIGAVPFAKQAMAWPGSQSYARWLNILRECDKIQLVDLNKEVEIEELCLLSKEVSVSPKYLIAQKLNKRNEWMVDHADCVLAIWKETTGGTGNCVKYAMSKNKKIIVYNPDTNQVSKYNVE